MLELEEEKEENKCKEDADKEDTDKEDKENKFKEDMYDEDKQKDEGIEITADVYRVEDFTERSSDDESSVLSIQGTSHSIPCRDLTILVLSNSENPESPGTFDVQRRGIQAFSTDFFSHICFTIVKLDVMHLLVFLNGD